MTDKSFYFNLKLLMDFLCTKCCGGPYFELQNMNLLLGCRDEELVKLTLSLFPLSPSPLQWTVTEDPVDLPPQFMHSQEGNNCL
jgi:hypothetical protein